MPGAAHVTAANTILADPRSARENFASAYEDLATAGGLVNVIEKALGVRGDDLAYYQAMPVAVQESIRAALYDAVTDTENSPAKPVQLSYVPALEYEARIVDYGEAVHIQIRGPYEAVSPGASRAPGAGS